MVSVLSTSDLRDVRHFAQKLFGRCRDSGNAYSSLARDIRRLRNALEEVEEVLTEYRKHTLAEIRVLTGVSSARDVLRQLDLALQSQRYSRQDADPAAVTSLRYTIETVTDELSAAFGEIEFRLGTSMDAMAKVFRSDLQSGSASSASSRMDRKSSIVSSALASQSSSTDITSLNDEPPKALSPSDEKEVFDIGRACLLSPSLSQERKPFDTSEAWRSPFALPDPMSMDVERASHMLISNSEELVLDSRARASPGKAANVHVPVSSTSRTLPVLKIQTAALEQTRPIAPKYDAAEASGLVATKFEGAAPTVGPYIAPAHPMDTKESQGPASPNDVPLAKVLASIMHLRMTEENLKQEGERLQASTYQPLEPPRSKFSEVVVEVQEQSKSGVPLLNTSSHDEQPAPERTAAPSAGNTLQANPELVEESEPKDSPHLKATPEAEPEPRPVRTSPSTASASPVAAPSPKPPSRAPPPPPPKPRRSRPRAPSAYRITNSSLPSASSSISSSEDLYTTSRPTSPIVAASPPRTTQRSPDIPHVSIDRSALGDFAPVSQRPVSYGTNRPASVAVNGSEKLAPIAQHAKSTPSLEIADQLAVRQKTVDLRPRRSVDETLNVMEIDRRLGTPAGVQRSRSVSAPKRANSGAAPQRAKSGAAPIPARGGPGVQEFYGIPVIEVIASAEDVDLDGERLDLICKCFNSQIWKTTEDYLSGHLDSLVEREDVQSTRRVRHLLGVCASYSGQWQRALMWFVAVLNSPIKSASDLDEADCAAAWWLGDVYSLLNRRTEALLAYCIAERNPQFPDPGKADLQLCLAAEQECVQLGAPKEHLQTMWNLQTPSTVSVDGDSILHTNIVTPAVAKICLETEPRKIRNVREAELDSGSGRGAVLYNLESTPPYGRVQRLRITRESFDVSSPWPMLYDPLFNLFNVQRGRFLVHECDLLEVFGCNGSAKVPRSSAVSLSRFDCFTCTDLQWLIATLRDCLGKLEMEWSEVANVEGTWFCVRHSFMQSKIATTHYFSIALFRHSVRSGYGVEICADGMCSARMIKSAEWQVDGVHTEEAKIVKKLIRNYLDMAAKQRKREAKANGNVNGTSFQELDRKLAEAQPPPLPPRPSRMSNVDKRVAGLGVLS